MDITQRLTRRFSRQALATPNFAYFVWRYVGNGVRTAGSLLTRRSAAGASAIAELRREGIVAGASERFLTPDGQQALAEAREQLLARSRADAVQQVVDGDRRGDKRKKDFLVHLASYRHGMASTDPLLRIALDQQLLEVVSGYLGLWPCLHSVGAWLNYPTDALPELSQLWHRDPEDLKLLKAFIYLTDVEEDCGPFTYIPGTQPFGPGNEALGTLKRKQRLSDEIMAAALPREAWRVCTGKAQTLILADTVGYHRGGKPAPGRHRILITFTYTSATPMTERKLRVNALPAWATSALQRFAVKPLVDPSVTPGVKAKGTRAGRAADE